MQPSGLTPASLYSAIVSALSFFGSLPLYFFCSSCILGCSACIARLDLSWLSVSGHVISFISSVKTMIARPKLPPNVRAIAIRTFVVGSTRIRWKRKLIWSMNLYCGSG